MGDGFWQIDDFCLSQCVRGVALSLIILMYCTYSIKPSLLFSSLASFSLFLKDPFV